MHWSTVTHRIQHITPHWLRTEHISILGVSLTPARRVCTTCSSCSTTNSPWQWSWWAPSRSRWVLSCSAACSSVMHRSSTPRSQRLITQSVYNPLKSFPNIILDNSIEYHLLLFSWSHPRTSFLPPGHQGESRTHGSVLPEPSVSRSRLQ
jgi:hypothetical protein